MVEAQLARRGIRDARVLEAMRTVPREEFVLPRWRDAAYDDRPLPIEEGQTISQPWVVARMAEAARVSAADRVLEVGGGSGYAAAVLGLLAREVHVVERHPPLAEAARARLHRLGETNVHVHEGDGTIGLPDLAPFDAIIVSAGGPRVPEALKAQLSDGGRLVIPTGTMRNSQRLLLVLREGEAFETEDLGAVCFVPLIGAEGWEP